MKKIKFTCTNCNAKLRVPTHLAGVSAPCPKCGATITAPTDITNAVDDEQDSRRRVSPTTVRSPRQEVSKMSSGGPGVTSGQVGANVAVIPKVTTSVEVPPPVSRPLQSRPLVQQVATEHNAPALFNPPPPLMPAVAGVPGNDVRSEAPVSLPPMPPVVVEISTFPLPSPARLNPVITEPIQVNSRPGALPESRIEASSVDTLPRLDVSLGGKELSSSAVLFPEGISQQGRTRVQLPQPGVETHKFSPDDFIVPASPPLVSPAPNTPVVAALPDLEPAYAESFLPNDAGAISPATNYRSIPLPNQMVPIPLEDLDATSFDDLPETNGDGEALLFAGEDTFFQNTFFPASADTDSFVPDFDLSHWDEKELDGGDQSAIALEVPWDQQQDPSASLRIQPGILTEEQQRVETAPVQPFRQTAPTERAPVNLYEELPTAPLRTGSFGKLFSQQSEQPAQTTSFSQGVPGDEGDVLENLFSDRPKKAGKSGGLSKTAIMMISCFAGAAILSTVVVIFFFESFGGGFDVAENYGVTGDPVDSKPALVEAGAPVKPIEPSLTDAPAVIDPVALIRETESSNSETRGASTAPGNAAPANPVAAGGTEPKALSFDEQVQRVVNGTDGASGTGGTGTSVIGAPGLDPVDGAISKFNGSEAPGGLTPLVAAALAPTPQTPATSQTPPPSEAPSAVDAAISTTESKPPLDGAGPEAGSLLNSSAAKAANYNPPASFAAPAPGESPLLRTNDVIDAFLRAPDWKTRIKYTFQGDSLQAAIEDYYKKWPDKKIDRYSLQLFQMEQSTELGGPYWVYLVSTSDNDQGFPLIIRVEEGKLKVDWEIYSEFYDRHFVRFREGAMPPPATFRVVIERVSEFYGTDKDAFTTVKDYHVYQVNPPYGDLNEFSEYAFVKNDSELAKKLDKVVGLGDEPLAVIVTLDEKAFEHGVKHYIVTEYLTEGWFR